ncbi:MAG: radical SAM protein [Dehalococcoidia bacterium]
MKYYRVILKLLGKALAFRRARLTNKPFKPEAVSLALTVRCNSHCIMCNMWRQAAEIPEITSLELTADEILSLLSRPLFSDLVEVDLTGGEPFLRNDLVEIVSGIVGLKKTGLTRLRSIIITSNGFMPEKIITGYREILKAVRGSDIDIVHVASLDGIGETHDKIRGTKGAYKLSIETLDGLWELGQDYPGFYIGVKTTVLPQNIDELEDILELAVEKGLFHIISPVFFTTSRFRNANKEESLQLTPAHHAKLLELYQRKEFTGNYFYSRIRELLSSHRRHWTCTAVYNYLFIDYDGSVYPCELLPEPIGNVKEKDIESIWDGKSAREWRKKINRTDTCRHCIEPGAVRYSAVREGLSYAGYLRHLGRAGYVRSLSGEGYYKYLRD